MKDHPLLDQAPVTLSVTPRHIRSSYIFWHTNGRPYLSASNQFSIAARTSGIDISFHDFRHIFAIKYLREGGSIYDLKQILGHSSVKTTEWYLDYLTPEQAANAKSKPSQIRSHG